MTEILLIEHGRIMQYRIILVIFLFIYLGESYAEGKSAELLITDYFVSFEEGDYLSIEKYMHPISVSTFRKNIMSAIGDGKSIAKEDLINNFHGISTIDNLITLSDEKFYILYFQKHIETLFKNIGIKDYDFSIIGRIKEGDLLHFVYKWSRDYVKNGRKFTDDHEGILTLKKYNDSWRILLPHFYKKVANLYERIGLSQ